MYIALLYNISFMSNGLDDNIKNEDKDKLIKEVKIRLKKSHNTNSYATIQNENGTLIAVLTESHGRVKIKWS